MAHKILVVEDDAELRSTVATVLANQGYDVGHASDGLEALDVLKASRYDLVLLDVNMPRLSGLDCLKRIKEMDPSIIVMVMTAYSTIDDAVRAVKDGAFHYLPKPIKQQAIVEMVQKALVANQMVEDMAFSAPVVQLDTGQFVGSSSEMQKIFGIIYKLAKVDTSVLIRGESGTGKELVARAIHFNSGRKNEKLVAINCSSITETLFESELFGHEKGSFTGADSRQIGKFQYAEGGTIFLDEIGDLSPAMQVKLLRVLQEKKFNPVGSHREIEMHARVISATNRNLEEMIKRGTFREDLFYRLNVIPVYLPPLRERKDDIEKLVGHFIRKFNHQHKKRITNIDREAMTLIKMHNWPGNIRELENVIEHAFVIENENRVTLASLPQYLRAVKLSAAVESPATNDASPAVVEVGGAAVASDPGGLDYQRHKEQFEKDFIVKALKTFHGRINQTAMHAKIPKKTLLRKLQKYNIRADDYRL